MKIVATPIPRHRLDSLPRLAARLPDFVALMKPRVMMLAVFTAVVGQACAPRRLDPLDAFLAVLAIAAGAGAAGILNMWYDADIDAVMARTAMRPIPRGKISQAEALALGTGLSIGAVLLLALATNIAAASLLGGAILFYIVVYTAWLKRSTRQNIVIGGAAGALPPVIGWAAATGDVGVEPLALFFIIFLWTPPHFWALALNRADDYSKAGIPMLPVVSGRLATKRQILIYSVMLIPASLLPCAIGLAGAVYGGTVASCGAIFFGLAAQLDRSGQADRRSAHRLFVFSIAYLFVLFAALLVDHSGNTWPSVSFSQRIRSTAALVEIDLLSTELQADRRPISSMTGEV
jgi:heme o synthase